MICHTHLIINPIITAALQQHASVTGTTVVWVLCGPVFKGFSPFTHVLGFCCLD